VSLALSPASANPNISFWQKPSQQTIRLIDRLFDPTDRSINQFIRLAAGDAGELSSLICLNTGQTRVKVLQKLPKFGI